MIRSDRFRILATLAVLSLPRLATADDREAGPSLIGHEALQARLKAPNVRILDARPRADYDKGHIPGAVWADPKPFQGLTKAEAIRDRAAWARAIAPLALSPEIDQVYVYDSARQHDAARLWWLLSYAGVKRVGLVDGGFALWEREKRPVTAEAASPAPYEFGPEFRADRLASRDEVRDASKGGSVQLLDARSAEEYRGEKVAKNQRAGGHIPGARSLDGYALVDEDGRFRGVDEQRRAAGGAGVAPDRPVIVYSQGGARSAIVAFAFERLGVPTRHYVPGLSDWASDPQAPIATGQEAARAAK